MSLLNKLLQTIDIWLPTEDKINTDKGRDFETFIASIFASQKEYFVIEDWTKDIYDKRAGINVESNKNPDFIIRYKPSNERFAVECKFRSGMYKSDKINDYVVKWSYPDQIQRYNDFSKRNKMSVFIVIGLGKTPDNPEYCFCIPLSSAKYPEIFPSVLEKFERLPCDKKFFWKNGSLS
jgi:hypothetical protein